MFANEIIPNIDFVLFFVLWLYEQTWTRENLLCKQKSIYYKNNLVSFLVDFYLKNYTFNVYLIRYTP